MQHAPAVRYLRRVRSIRHENAGPEIGGWRCAQYDGIVAMAAGEHFGRGQGVSSMRGVVLLLTAIGWLLAGLVAIGFGIQINEFSLGNTLIVAKAR